VLLAVVLGLGTVGYVVVGLEPFDALYQTAITVTTVGYGEMAPSDEIDTSSQSYTTNPGADLEVAAGDLLLVLGSQRQLLELEHRFSRRPVLRVRGHDVTPAPGSG
jgi:hypothetical protein